MTTNLIRTPGSPAELRSARWVAGLFLTLILLQRFAIPGLPLTALLVAVVPLWMMVALAKRVVELDRTRLMWLLVFAALSTVLIPLQARLVPGVEISLPAWLLLLTALAPLTLRLVERSTTAYQAALYYICRIAFVLAVVTILMMVSQLVGIGYTDVFAAVVPQSLQLGGYTISYPVVFGSPLYKANAWIGLEPSVVSVQLAIGLLAGLLTRARWWMIGTLVVGLICTVSGSGVVVVLVGVVVIALHRSRKLLFRYLPIVFVALIVASVTEIGGIMFARATEFQSANSSSSLRAINPYSVIFPRWTEHLSGVVLGYGPGSSSRLVADTNVLGLQVPTPAKIFYEYGLVGGIVLAGFCLICYWGGPSRAMALGTLALYWLIMPAITSPVALVPLAIVVTLWSPRTGPVVESLLDGDPGDRANRPWRADELKPASV